jgi:hypothetical protein
VADGRIVATSNSGRGVFCAKAVAAPRTIRSALVAFIPAITSLWRQGVMGYSATCARLPVDYA